MNNKEIRSLLEKYWRAETDLEEERQLKNYLAGREGLTGFENEELLFRYFREIENTGLPQEFDEKLLEQVSHQPSSKTRKLNIFNWKAAAAVSVLVVVSIVLINQPDSSDQIADTYEDPREAYEATRAVLMTISTNLNKGKAYTRQLSKFSEAQEMVSGNDAGAVNGGS